MNLDLINEVSKGCLAGTLSFPEAVGKLKAAGIESYHVDLIKHEARYYAGNGRSFELNMDFADHEIAPEFNAQGVVSAIRDSQAQKITYKQFLERAMSAGTSYYIAYLDGKRVIYLGRNGDSHTEYFPK